MDHDEKYQCLCKCGQRVSWWTERRHLAKKNHPTSRQRKNRHPHKLVKSESAKQTQVITSRTPLSPSPQPMLDTTFSLGDFGDAPTEGLEDNMDLDDIAMHACRVLDDIDNDDGDGGSGGGSSGGGGGDVDSETGEALPLVDSDAEDGIQTAEDELDRLWELDVAEACKSNQIFLRSLMTCF